MFGRYDRLRTIRALDPEADHWQIYRFSAGFEFPWDYRKALEFALFRTYCVPSISGLLDATREFADRTQRRYDDTLLLMAELTENGYDSERGRTSLSRINLMHGRYAISNDDMLYVLSTFVFEPIRWIGRFGWRPLSEHEKLAGFHFYRAVGRRMGIKDIPSGYREFEAFNVEYERANFHYSDTNHRVGTSTVDLFCSWYPAPARTAARHAVLAALDRPLLEAFGFPEQPGWLQRTVSAGLRARSQVVWWLPPRRVSKMTSDPRNRTYPNYPNGYEVSELGAGPPPADLDQKWFAKRVRAARVQPKA